MAIRPAFTANHNEITVIQNRVQDAQTEGERARADLQSANTTLQNATQRVTSAQTSVSDATTAVTDKTNALKTAQDTATQIAAQAKSKQTEVTTQTTSVRNLTTALNTANGQLSRANGQLRAANSRTLPAPVMETREERDALGNVIRTVTEETEASKHARAQAQTDKNQAIADAQNAVDSATEAVNTAQGDLDAAQATLETLQTELDTLRTQETDANALVTTLSSELNTLQETLTHAQEQLNTAIQEQTEAQNQVNTAMEAVNASEEAKALAEEELQAAQDALNAADDAEMDSNVIQGAADEAQFNAELVEADVAQKQATEAEDRLLQLEAQEDNLAVLVETAEVEWVTAAVLDGAEITDTTGFVDADGDGVDDDFSADLTDADLQGEAYADERQEVTERETDVSTFAETVVNPLSASLANIQERATTELNEVAAIGQAALGTSPEADTSILVNYSPSFVSNIQGFFYDPRVAQWIIDIGEARYPHIDPLLIMATMLVESKGNPGILNTAGAVGLGQVMEGNVSPGEGSIWTVEQWLRRDDQGQYLYVTEIADGQYIADYNNPAVYRDLTGDGMTPDDFYVDVRINPFWAIDKTYAMTESIQETYLATYPERADADDPAQVAEGYREDFLRQMRFDYGSGLGITQRRDNVQKQDYYPEVANHFASAPNTGMVMVDEGQTWSDLANEIIAGQGDPNLTIYGENGVAGQIAQWAEANGVSLVAGQPFPLGAFASDQGYNRAAFELAYADSYEATHGLREGTFMARIDEGLLAGDRSWALYQQLHQTLGGGADI